MFLSVFIGYAKKLIALQAPLGVYQAPSTKRCQEEPAACQHIAQCYTDASPHYSNTTLRGIVVGSHKWIYKDNIAVIQKDRSGPEIESRPIFYTAEGPAGGEIFFRVTVTPIRNRVLVCGLTMKGVVNELEFRIDLHVDDGIAGKEYMPKTNRNIWVAKEMYKKFPECVAIKDIPAGSHVIGVESKGVKKHVGISHIITWR